MPTIDETKNVRTQINTAGNTLLTRLNAEGLEAWRNGAREALIATVKGQDRETTIRLADALGYRAIEALVTNMGDIQRSNADPNQKATQLSKKYEELGEVLAQYSALTFGICAKATTVPGDDNVPPDVAKDDFRLRYILTH